MCPKYGVFFLALTGMLAFFAISCAGNIGEDRPNIIFIMADDLGYGDLGSYGQKLIQTPYLDQMADEGTRFTNVYAGATVCAPSRSVLMTGQHTGHTTVRGNSGHVGGVKDEMTGDGNRIPLLKEDITIAEILSKAGYTTGITGKWGLGEAGTAGVPNLQGFEEWYGYLNQNHAVFYFTDYLWHNTQRDSIRENQDKKRQVYTHDLFTDFALDFIRRKQNEPFFLYIPYTIPHFNLEVPSIEPYTEKTDWPHSSKIYASMVTRMDRDVGRILELVKRLDIDENTLIFFTSDNGPDYNKGPVKGDSLFNSNGPLKGAKGSLDEGGIRVPMIIRWPSKVPVGEVNDQPWYLADVLPTLAALGGAETPSSSDIDGIDVLPTLLGDRQNLQDRFMYWEEPPPNLDQAVRRGPWKVRRNGPNDTIKLYNLTKDPGEKNNVASQNPEVVAMFAEYLETARTDSPFWPME